MPDLNDFYAFKSTSGGNNGGCGCSGGAWIWVIVVFVVLYFIGKLG